VSAAAAAPLADAAAVAPAKKGKKKLIVIALAVLLLLAIAGGAAVFVMKKKAAAAAAEADEPAAAAGPDAHHSGKPDLKHPPTFLPLDPFVVNLADKESDRYAQIGLTFEVEDAKFAESMKAFMPAIRNGILMILSHKSSAELMGREGKEQLAAEILRESARTMGIEVETPEPVVAKTAPATDGDAEDAKPKKKARKKPPLEPNPIKHVHFSNFIVQ
jgi:flagellar protein FliL